MERIITNQRDKSLEQRAKEVLGLAREANIDLKKLKKAFRTLAKHHHPDRGGTTQYMKLINQAKGYLARKTTDTTLLEDDLLCEAFLGETPKELKKSYGNWIIDYAVERGFYDFLSIPNEQNKKTENTQNGKAKRSCI